MIRVGDRVCPDCNEMSLVEKGLTKWKCLNCGEEFTTKELDVDVEWD